MPSIKYYNQTAPFWDFVASLEQTGAQHPCFNRGNGEGSSTEQQQQQQPSWAEAWGPWHGRPMPHHPHPRGPPSHHHGRGGRHGHGHHPPPPPGEEPPHHGDHPPPPPPPPEFDPEHSPDTLMGDNEKAAEGTRDLISGDEGAISGPEGRHRRRGFGGGPCRGRGRRGSPHGHGPEHHGPGPHRGGRHHRGGGGPPFPFGAPWGMGCWADFLTGNVTGENNNNNSNNNTTDRETEDFKPEADVFDTESAYVVHLSLAGAKKEDIGVSWDAEKSELSVAGVIHRPGDEEFLKTLALDERRVGVFERKVRLGSRANPAQVDADGITAKLTDGVLVVEVPKLDKDYVEIRKVDIE